MNARELAERAEKARRDRIDRAVERYFWRRDMLAAVGLVSCGVLVGAAIALLLVGG